MPKYDPAQLERDWREALRALLGEELEQASYFQHVGGWYYTRWGQRFPDGSVGCFGKMAETGKRASQIIAETAAIRARAAADNKRPAEKRWLIGENRCATPLQAGCVCVTVPTMRQPTIIRSFRFTPDVLEFLRDEAEREGRSANNVAQRLLDQARQDRERADLLAAADTKRITERRAEAFAALPEDERNLRLERLAAMRQKQKVGPVAPDLQGLQTLQPEDEPQATCDGENANALTGVPA